MKRSLLIVLALLFSLGANSAFGAIAVTNRASSGSTTNALTYTTASFTPTANALLVICFDTQNASSVNPSAVTISDNLGGSSLTYTNITDFLWVDTGTTRARLSIVAAQAGGSPGAMTITGTYTGTTCTGARWSVFEVTGSDVANGVSQCFIQNIKTTANATGTSLSITLGSAGNSNNRSFLWCGHTANQSFTIQTNWAEIGFGSHGTPNSSSDSQWRSSAFDTAVSTSWATSGNYGGIAFEIKANTSAVTIFRNRTGSRNRVMP